MGINPSQVLFIAVGRNEVRMPALVSGAIDAAPLVRVIWWYWRNRSLRCWLTWEKKFNWCGTACRHRTVCWPKPAAGRALPARARQGREFARRYKDDTVVLIGKHDPSSVDAIRVDYDVTKASMTDEGWLPDDVLREEVATRAELTKVANPPSPAALFDYSFTKRNYAQLKASGWQPSR